MIKTLTASFGLLSVIMFHATPTLAEEKRVELLMMEQAGCGYCQQWKRDIGVAYPNTEEAKIAPLRMIDIHKDLPADLEVKPTRFTPTFVLAIDGQEVSRIEGYLSEDFFWGYLNRMLEKHAK